MRYLIRLLLVIALSSGVACSRTVPVEELLERARVALAKGDLSGAEVDVKAALQQGATNADARQLYGEIYLERLEAAAAVEQFERALATASRPETLILLARALLEAGESAEVVSNWDAEKYITVATDPEFRAVLARALLAQEDYARARESLAAAAAAESPYADVTRALFAISLEKDTESARSLLEGVVATHPGHGQAWSLLAAIALDNGDRESAVELLGKAVEANPYRLSDRLERIRLQIAMGNAAAAEPDLARLERQAPNYPPVQYLRGQVLFDAGDYKNALDMLSRVLGVAPDHPGALMLAANANIREGNLETAQRQLARFRSNFPSDLQSGLMLGSVALQLGDAPRAEQLARQILEEHGMNTRAMGLLAAALAAQGQNAESAQYYEQIAAQVPDSSAALTALGAQEILAGDEAGGLARLEAAVALEPTNWAARERLIEALLGLERFSDAAAAAQAYVDAGGGARAHVYLGRARVRQDRLDDANASFLEALALSPGDPTVSANLAALSVVRGDTAEARRTLEQALEANPGDLATSLRLAALQEQAKDMEAVEATLRAAIDANPAATQPRVALARLELARGGAEEAAALLAPLGDAANSNPVVLELLVRAYLATGELEAAENYARRLLAQRPDDAATLALVGQVYNARGRFEVAEKHLRSAREKFPGDVTLHKLLIEALVYQGKLELATQEVAALPEAVRQEVAVIVLRGRLALAERDTDEAIRLFGLAFERQPNSVTLGFLAGARWAAGDREGAMTVLEDWLADNPDDVLTLTTAANREMERGNLAVARGYYERILAVQPRSVLALNNLAWLLKDSDTATALDYIQRADALAPDTVAIKDTYAMVELARGNHQRALALIDTALENAPEAPDLLYNRAQILIAAGRRDEARELLSALVAGPVFGSQGEAAKLLETL